MRKGESIPFEVRFWKKVRKTESCWQWIGAKTGSGYGAIRTGTKGTPQIGAHVASWLINRGPIPDDLCVLHNCPDGDDPGCVNPAHLFLGTQADNARDKCNKGRWKGGAPSGERCGSARLSETQVKEIFNIGNSVPHRELAKRYSVSHATIRNILHGITWRETNAGLSHPAIGRPRGVRNTNAKLTSDQVREIRTSSNTQRELASVYGVHQAAIWAVLHYKTWKEEVL